MLLTAAERLIVKRYILPAKGEGFIFLVASISLVAVMLGVAALVIVMSVMNGFRAEMFDKITGLNGHAVIQGYDGQLSNWRDVMAKAKATPGVTSATPLIEKGLVGNYDGRIAFVVLRGMTDEDIAKMPTRVLGGSLNQIKSGTNRIAIGAGLAEQWGARVGSMVTIINFEGVTTPFGTVPRQMTYQIGAIFEIGISQFDANFAVLPLPEAQTLMLMGDSVGMIEVRTKDPDQVGDILAPLTPQVARDAVITDWRTMNRQMFEALEVERVAMFVVLSIIILVAVFNILSSLIMLVRTKTRDIAIMRTMGATRSMMMRNFVTVCDSIGKMGTLLGLGLGFLFLYFRQGIVNVVQLITGQNLWDPSIRFLTELPSKPDPVEIIIIAAMAMLFSFLATLYPAFKAANTDPVQVLRYE